MSDRHSPILPEGYEVPMAESSFFNKFPEGDTRFRMLSPVTVGWRYWNLDNKPVHSRDKWEVQPPDARVDEENPWNPQHFWVFVAGMYETESVQVMQITQKGIMKEIEGFLRNEKWGDSRHYDIVVTRTGTSLNDTKYTVMPEPPSPAPDWIREAMENMSVKLDNVFTEEQRIVTIGAGASNQLGVGQVTPDDTTPLSPEEQRKANGVPSDEELEQQKSSSEEDIRIEDIPF